MSEERARPRDDQGGREGEVPPAPVERAAAPGALGQGGDATFSEEQVGKILRRVAELERGRSAKKPELTLAEVETIAREAGLDPSLVQLAARSLREEPEQRGAAARIFGAPLRRTFERVIDGEMTLQTHETMADELRRVFRDLTGGMRPARIASVGRTLTASAFTGGGRIELELIPRSGKTLLRVHVDYRGLAGGLLGGIGGGAGFSLLPLTIPICQGTAHPVVLGLSLGAAWLGSLGLSLRALIAWRVKARYREMEQLADRLAAKLRDELAAK